MFHSTNIQVACVPCLLHVQMVYVGNNMLVELLVTSQVKLPGSDIQTFPSVIVGECASPDCTPANQWSCNRSALHGVGFHVTTTHQCVSTITGHRAGRPN